jgi:hypothetical protein
MPYLVSHLMYSTSSVNWIVYKCSSMDFHIKLLFPDEIVVVHQSSLWNCLADSEVSGCLEAQTCQDSGVLFCFGRYITVLVYLSL